MARKNEFKKTDKKNIFSLKMDNGDCDYYATFRLNGIYYQKKNLTKMKDSKATTLAKASDFLDYIKTELRNGNNPFAEQVGDKIKDIILKSIRDKTPLKEGGDNTVYLKHLERFYMMYINPVIGNLKIGLVEDYHVEKIMKSIEKFKKGYKLYLNVIMNPIFEKALRERKIKYNPFYKLDYGNHTEKPSFDLRLNESMKDLVRKLYIGSKEFDKSHRLLFLLLIMLARRVGEIYQLKYSHIKKYSDGSFYIIATRNITKTRIEEKYPLPKEIVKLLPNDIFDKDKRDEKLFKFSRSRIYIQWEMLVIESGLMINDGYKITPHDTRNLFISILTELGVDSALSDRCLSHNKNDIKSRYLETPYETRLVVFKKWWKFLRNKKKKKD